jgi:hypothetical protein
MKQVKRFKQDSIDPLFYYVKRLKDREGRVPYEINLVQP